LLVAVAAWYAYSAFGFGGGGGLDDDEGDGLALSDDGFLQGRVVLVWGCRGGGEQERPGE